MYGEISVETVLVAVCLGFPLLAHALDFNELQPNAKYVVLEPIEAWEECGFPGQLADTRPGEHVVLSPGMKLQIVGKQAIFPYYWFTAISESIDDEEQAYCQLTVARWSTYVYGLGTSFNMTVLNGE